MAVNQEQIDELLDELEAMWHAIAPLQERARELEAELAAAQRDYERVLGGVNAAAERLERRHATLQALLARHEPPPPPPPPPPPKTPAPVGELAPGALPPPPPPEDPRAVRKRALADHIYYFLDADQEGLMQEINAMVGDAQRDVGDMLERLAWGEIWRARASWESLEEQYRRLEGWRTALEARLNYWERAVQRLEEDPRQDLLAEMNERGREGWEAYLEGLKAGQEAENERLRAKVAVLEEAWQDREAEDEEDGAPRAADIPKGARPDGPPPAPPPLAPPPFAPPRPRPPAPPPAGPRPGFEPGTSGLVRSPARTITRFPDASLPERVTLGRRCALRVAVTQQPVTPAVAELAMTLTMPSAAEAVAVDVLVTAPDFEIVGDPYRELVVPAEGDSDPLLFQLVPKVAGAKRVKVEFFQASRYVGGLTLETTVVESASAADERPGRVAGWLGLEREAVAADLTLLVTECPADGEHRVFRFTVHSPANGLFYHPIGEPLRFDGPPSGWMDNLYRELGYLGGEADPEDLAETLGSIGADLYERLFPAELKRLWGERVRGRVDTLMIISDEPWIPWELIKPSYETEGGGYEEEDFLCAGYLLTRWLAGPSPPSRIRVARSALIAPALVDLPHVQQEVSFLKAHLAGVQEVAPELAGVRALLREGGYQLFHFACHGSFDAGEHEQAVVYLQGNDVLRSREISGARRGFSRDRPFVFLNACQTGRGDFSLVGVGSWADRFVRANSSGFIGSSWEVNDGLAYRFSSRFYEALGEGVAVGAAVRQARLAIREEPDPSWLAYTLYADPLAVVSFG